ncbi:FtsX-like permease family protein [Actinomadura sp. 6K520]|uniref:FtsX-like permease family protein n=1 Tax=Actinomadura sp. 6K520 TaxID=2530364 RepID=UPI0010469338|nr:FtsX-like permease family protein [Actinomadura sp. 6K520]TDE18824.1 ABC transporter permease [Actinomadura sp. 6K520]
MGRRRGFVTGRMAGDRTLVLAACATALFTTAVLAALAGYTGPVTREGMRRTLADATFETAGTTIGAHVRPGGLAEVQDRVRRALGRIYGDVPLAVSMSVRGDSYTLPGQENGDHPELTTFATYTGIERHARLTAGRWPGAGGGSGEVEAVLPRAAADAMAVEVDDAFTLKGRVDTTSAVDVRVVGLFDVPDPGNHFWQGDRLVTTGAERLDYTTYGPLVVTPEVFGERFGGTGSDARFAVLPDLSGLDTGDLGPLARRVSAGEKTLREGGDGAQYSVVTELPELLRQLREAVQVARSAMLIPVIQLVLLAGCAWLLVARLLADHRRGEVALLRTRGMGMRQLAAAGLAEGLLVVLPAAVLGPLLAGPLLRLAGYAPAVRASGLRPATGPSPALWVVSVVVALACAVALTIPTLRGANRTFVAAQAGLGRPGRGVLRGSGVDLALLLVAGLAVWQLTRYGVDGAGGDPGGGPGGVDPFIVSGPALALLAGGVLLLRAVPVVSRAAERVATRGRGLVPALGTRQVGRRRIRYTGPVLLLVMAMAVGVLSVTTISTWSRSHTDRADFRSGADLRFVPSPGAEGPAPLGRGGRFAALPGVTSATPVLRADAGLGTRPAVLLGADAKALGPLLRVPADLRRDLRLEELARARPAAPALTVPGRPERLLLDLRLSPADPGHRPPPGEGHELAVTIVDGQGFARKVPLPGLAADGDEHTLVLDDLAGPGGALSYPLSVRSLHYSYDANPPAEGLVLDILAVRGDGTGEAPRPAGSRWGAFARSPDVTKRLDPRVADMEGALGRLTIPATPEDPRTSRITEPLGEVSAVLGTSAPPSRGPGGTAGPGNTDLQPAVPGVITGEAARRAGTGVGGTVTLSTVDGDQPVKVVGVAPALPSVPPDVPAVLVDLPTLTRSRLTAGGADTGSITPGEWWAAAREGRTGPAVRALTGHPAWGEVAADRAALRSQRRDAHLGAALQGALVLGFGAALAFAVIAFVLNAAVTAGARSRELAVLRALGVRPRQIAGMFAIEQAYLVVLGLLGGTVLGLVVARLVVPHVVLSVQAAQPYPPAELVVRWPVVLGMLAGVAVVLGLVLPPVVRTLRRRNLGAGLRAGEDR